MKPMIQAHLVERDQFGFWTHPKTMASSRVGSMLYSLISKPLALPRAPGFYPISTDGLKRAENFRSCLATLRRILGL